MPGIPAAANLFNEVAQQPPALLGVGDLRMELQPEDRTAAVFDRGAGTGLGLGKRRKVVTEVLDLIAYLRSLEQVSMQDAVKR